MIKLRPDQLDLRLGFLRPVHAGAQEKMAASLIRHDQLTAVVAVEDGGCHVLIDGFKRQRCARQLGMKTLKVTVLKKSDAEAKALLYLLNRPDGFSTIMEALLVRELVEIEGLNQVEAATLLERHKSWVCRRLFMIRNLAPEIVHDIKLELLPAGVGSSLARLQPATQADFSLAIQKYSLNSREVSRLVDLWCKIKDPGARQHLLESPRQVLKVIRQDKENYYLIIDAILSKMSTLNSRLGSGTINGQKAAVLKDFIGRVKAQMERLNELIGGHHEPIR